MNFAGINTNYPERLVHGISKVTITDDFGSYMRIGDAVQVQVMPFDYCLQGTLEFDYNQCAFFVKHEYGRCKLSRFDDVQDMNSSIIVTKTFKLLSEGPSNV